MTNTTDVGNDFWGHGLTSMAPGAQTVDPLLSLPVKINKKQQKQQYEQSFFKAIEEKDALKIQNLMNDPLLPTINMNIVQDKALDFFDEKIIEMLEGFFDENGFDRAFGSYAQHQNPHPKLLPYLFEKGLLSKTQQEKTSFLTTIYRWHLTDIGDAGLALKKAILKSEPHIFDEVVGEQANSDELLEVFEQGWHFYQEGDTFAGGKLFEEFNKASWKKVMLYLLSGESYILRQQNLSKENLMAFEKMFSDHSFLKKGYEKAQEQVESDLKSAQKIVDAYLPIGVDFDESPYWKFFSTHEEIWSTPRFKKPHLLVSLTGRYGLRGNKNTMALLTTRLRQTMSLPWTEDSYHGSFSNFFKSHDVPKTPVKRWRGFAEVFLCGSPSSFLTLDFENLNQVLQSACKHNDVLLELMYTLPFDDFKNLVQRVPELKTRRLENESVGEVWGRYHRVSSKTLLQNMFRLAPEWFEEESTLLDIFTSNGLKEEHLRQFQKTMFSKHLRKDQGEAGRKIRSRKKVKRQM